MTASIVVALLVAGVAAVIWQLRAIRREASTGVRDVWDEDRERWTPRPTPPLPRRVAAPVIDTRPGIDLDARDTCELLYNLPARHPGPERLWQAIRDQQQKGD